ncbi:MAG: cysteine desulfurase family protein [Paenibacillaceae bacterium]
MNKIYLDYNASTPVDSLVKKVMVDAMELYGNPSSNHWAGVQSQQVIQGAREQVANLLGCSPSQIVFTSGGTESNNLALIGVFQALRSKGNHIITTQIEHPSILNVCKYLETQGARVTYVEVDRFGRVSPEHIDREITDQTILISVMHANNEVGTIQPIKEIGQIANLREITLHTDAAQSVGKIPTRVDDMQVDFLSIAGHKLYAPKGIGALYVRDRAKLSPILHGAGHEGGIRPGTENIVQIAALGKACEIAEWRINEQDQIRELTNYLWNELQIAFGNRVVRNGHPIERLPNTLNVSFVGRKGFEILNNMPEIAASAGSACHSGSTTISPVLKAMRIDPEIALGSIRFSLGCATTQDEIDNVVEWLEQSI